MLNPKVDEHPKLAIPPENTLIASNFDLLPKDDASSAVPKLIKQWEGCTDLWYKKDDKFEKPKTFVNMNLYTNDSLFGLNPQARAFSHLWKEVVDEYLREFNYMASEAKLDFSIGIAYDRLSFKWSGFNHKLPELINEMIQRVLDMKNQNIE